MKCFFFTFLFKKNIHLSYCATRNPDVDKFKVPFPKALWALPLSSTTDFPT